MYVSMRNRIAPSHPVFGDGYRKLNDDEVLQPGDETACVSILLSLAGDKWVAADWADGKTTVLESLAEDGDGEERVYRRKV